MYRENLLDNDVLRFYLLDNNFVIHPADLDYFSNIQSNLLDQTKSISIIENTVKPKSKTLKIIQKIF